MNKASCLSLLSNAVLVWNTTQMSQIVDRLRAAREDVPDSDLAHVSPLMFGHIIPNGTYWFDRHNFKHPASRLPVGRTVDTA